MKFLPFTAVTGGKRPGIGAAALIVTFQPCVQTGGAGVKPAAAPFGIKSKYAAQERMLSVFCHAQNVGYGTGAVCSLQFQGFQIFGNGDQSFRCGGLSVFSIFVSHAAGTATIPFC